MTDKQKLDEILDMVRYTLDIFKSAPKGSSIPTAKMLDLFVAMEADMDALIKKSVDV